MSINTKRGFTLMELLVVIAIIGILASVVLASLNSARAKGADAAVKSNINNARAQAELFYDNTNNTYTGLCAATTGILNMYTAADTANGAGTSPEGTAECASDANEWVLGADLVSVGADQFYCADYTGWSGTTTAANIGTADGDLDCN